MRDRHWVSSRLGGTRARWAGWLGAVTLLTLLAFALRVYRLDFISLRGDEAFTVLFVQRTWEGLWRGISTIEPNPPLLYLALRGWIALVGASEFAARYFSVCFGVLCVPLLYRLTREMLRVPYAARAALLAAALLALNPYQVWHSQDVRNYTLWPCLSLLALVFLWRWWKREVASSKSQVQSSKVENVCGSGVFGPLSLYVLATLASLYTHYYDTFILAAVNVFVFAFTLSERRGGTLARWVSAQGVIALLYAPWVLFGTNRITTYGEGSAESGVSLLEVFSRTLSSFVLGDTLPNEFKTWLWLPLAFALGAIMLRHARQDRPSAVFLLLWIAIPTFAQYLVSLGRPLFLERYLNAIAPAYYLVFALGLTQLAGFGPWALRSRLYVSRFAYAVGLIFFVAMSAYALGNYYFEPAYAKAPNWRALMQYIKDHREPGDFVIQNFTEAAPIYYRGDLPVLTVPRDFWATPADEEFLRQLNDTYRRIWFIPASPNWWDPDQFVEKFLARTNERIAETPLDIFRLQLYLTPRAFESAIIPLGARVGDATLVGYRVEGTREARVVLFWRADKPLANALTVFAHITDAQARIVAQDDRAPAFGLYPTTAWQPGERVVDAHPLRVTAAPGTYTIIVGMYDPNTLERVPAFDANGTRLPNDQVSLTSITIIE